MSFGLRLLAVFSAAAVVVSTAAAGSRTFVPALLRSGHTLAYKPRHLVAAGDGTAILTHIRYRTYGGPGARATATLLVDDCSKSCATGTFHAAPARLLFAGAVRCHGKRVYSTVRIRAPEAVRFNGVADRTVNLTYLAFLCEPGER